MVVECATTLAQSHIWSKLIKTMDSAADPETTAALSSALLPLVLSAVTKHATMCR